MHAEIKTTEIHYPVNSLNQWRWLPGSKREGNLLGGFQLFDGWDTTNFAAVLPYLRI